MSSNIQVERICQHCNGTFVARTTVTKYCSHRCASAAYKARKREEKVEKSNTKTYRIKVKPITELNAKEFLTVRDVATLLDCSVRMVYRLIEKGTIKGINLSKRMIRVKRSEIDKLLS